MSVYDAKLLATTCISEHVVYWTDKYGQLCGYAGHTVRKNSQIYKAMKLYNYITGKETTTLAKLCKWLKSHRRQVKYMIWELDIDEFDEWEMRDILKELSDAKHYLATAEDRHAEERGALQRRIDELEKTNGRT